MTIRHSLTTFTACLALGIALTAGCNRTAPDKASAQPPASAPATAATAGKLEIRDATTRETPPNATVGVAYLTVVNGSAKDDVLLGASSSAAGSVELHSMSMDNGVMQMRALPEGLPVPAGQSVTLGSGGTHLMLVDLKQPLVAGQKIPLGLRFRDAGERAVELDVRPLAD